MVQRQVEPEEEDEEKVQTKLIGDQITPLVQRQVEPEEEDEEKVQTKLIGDQITPLIQRQAEPEEEDEEKVQTKLISDQITPLIQRQAEPEEEEEKVQTKAASLKINDDACGIESHINSHKGGGRPLPQSERHYFEPRFGRDLSGVRLYSDSSSAESTRSVNALAYTVGRSIFFGRGNYNPGSNEGRRLIAHELTHVIQQRPDAAPFIASANRVGLSSAQKNQTAKSPIVNAFPAGQQVIARLDGAEALAPPQGETAETTAAPAPRGPAEVVSLDGVSTFEPPAAIASSLEALGEEAGEVPVCLGNIARGNIRVRKINGEYETYPRERPQTIPLRHPVLEPLRTRIGINPVLALSIRANNISGYASVATEREAPDPSALISSLRENFEAMGWLGMEPVRFPGTKNDLEAGILKLKVEGFSFRLGGFLDGTGSFGLENEIVTFEANAAVHLRGLTDAQLEISRDEEGNLGGQAEVPVNFANFSGNLIASFGSGTVDIEGTARYTTEKLSGEITLLVTDAATARNVALQRLGPEAVQAAAEEAQGARSGRPRPGARALAGWGLLDFQFTEWMTGQAQVIIDNEGNVTVVGRITPPAEIELFPQRDYIRRLFVFEVRTLYGVPLVGNVFLFANVGMEALAKLGPGKIYRIEILGTYSTDPRVFQNFSISATLNISAFAGLRLRGEGGAGLELLGHDIKAGVGLNALAGVRGYVEATPTIGYRETAAPQEGKQGEFYIRGHMELAAQPFLGLGGDLFVELDSPFWSPAPDHKWTWPVGELEYPLPGEFGIGADVDYVIGSNELPEIQFGEVDFNADRFMTDLMSDHVPRGSHGEQEQPGEWNEGEVTGAPEEPQQVDSQGAPSAEPVRGRQRPEEGEAPRPEVQERWMAGLRALGELSERSQTDPFDQREIDAALERIRRHYRFSELRERRAGDRWRVHAEMNPETDMDLSAEGPGAEGEEGPEHEARVQAGLRAIDQEERRYLYESKISREDAERVAATVRRSHEVFKSIVIIDGGNTWDYHYEASPGNEKDGPTKLKLSKYVIIENGQLMLHNDYRNKKVIRRKFYGKYYWTSVIRERDRLLETNQGSGGLRNPNNANEYFYAGRFYINSGNTKASLDHQPMIVQHWNDHQGNNMPQRDRVEFYNFYDDKDKIKNNIKPLSLNSSEGASAGERYKPEVGQNFRGPNDEVE